MPQPKKRKVRDTALATVDRDAPAYRIIYGPGGGLTGFCRITGVPKSSAHLWLKVGHIPVHRQAHIRAKFAEAGIRLDPLLFVPAPKAEE